MLFRNQDEPIAPAHFPDVSWLLLAFVALSVLVHGLSLLLSPDHEVKLAEHRFGATLISTVLSPARDQPGAQSSGKTPPEPQTKKHKDALPQSSTETQKPSPVSTISTTRHTEFKIDSTTDFKTLSGTSSETATDTTLEPIHPHRAPETYQQTEPVITTTASENDETLPGAEQLARQQKEQQEKQEKLEKQRNYLLGELQNRLSRYLSYPVVARRRGWQGEVMVAFDINVAGQLHNVRLAHSSGYAVLDHSAVTAINKLQQIALPDTLGQLQAMELQLPVRYQLHES